jgi:hypothetical protein
VRGRGAVALVYLAEAHAADEWPIGWRHPIAQTSGSAPARAAAAALFVAEQGATLSLVLDTPDDAFDAAYAAWPLRAYGLLPPRAPGEAPVVDFVAQPRSEGYYPWHEVEHWLLTRCAAAADASEGHA